MTFSTSLRFVQQDPADLRRFPPELTVGRPLCKKEFVGEADGPLQSGGAPSPAPLVSLHQEVPLWTLPSATDPYLYLLGMLRAPEVAPRLPYGQTCLGVFARLFTIHEELPSLSLSQLAHLRMFIAAQDLQQRRRHLWISDYRFSDEVAWVLREFF